MTATGVAATHVLEDFDWATVAVLATGALDCPQHPIPVVQLQMELSAKTHVTDDTAAPSGPRRYTQPPDAHPYKAGPLGSKNASAPQRVMVELTANELDRLIEDLQKVVKEVDKK